MQASLLTTLLLPLALGVIMFGLGLGLDETGAASPPPQPTRRSAPTARVTVRRIDPRYVGGPTYRAVRPGGGVSSISTVSGHGVCPARRSHLTSRCRRT